MSETLVHVASGKVRELFTIDDERLLLVASDRISTFDVVLPTEIPDKGRVLTGLSAFWFARTRDVCANHLLELRPDGRSTECRRLEMLPLECVVRGYLAGSGWKDYLRAGSTSGHALPRRAARVGPAARSRSSRRRRRRRAATTRTSTPRRRSSWSARERYEEVERTSLALYRFAAEHAAARGILIADTKFEFGLDADGEPRARRRGVHAGLVALLAGRRVRARAARSRPSTSSSSATTASRSAGTRPPPGPELPDDVVAGTRARYVEAFERLTGIAFDDYLADPSVVLA